MSVGAVTGDIVKAKRATAAEKRELLLKQKAELEARINTVEAEIRMKARKEDTRLKIIVGAAVLANAELHPETRDEIVAVLKRAVTSPRDRQFLASKGFLD